MGMDLKGDKLTRLAVCAAVAAGVVFAGEQLCSGKDWPLWQKYGPWITQNKLQVIAILAVLFYVVSLTFWPEEEKSPQQEPHSCDDGFTACS